MERSRGRGKEERSRGGEMGSGEERREEKEEERGG